MRNDFKNKISIAYPFGQKEIILFSKDKFRIGSTVKRT